MAKTSEEPSSQPVTVFHQLLDTYKKGCFSESCTHGGSSIFPFPSLLPMSVNDLRFSALDVIDAGKAHDKRLLCSNRTGPRHEAVEQFPWLKKLGHISKTRCLCSAFSLYLFRSARSRRPFSCSPYKDWHLRAMMPLKYSWKTSMLKDISSTQPSFKWNAGTGPMRSFPKAEKKDNWPVEASPKLMGSFPVRAFLWSVNNCKVGILPKTSGISPTSSLLCKVKLVSSSIHWCNEVIHKPNGFCVGKEFQGF